MIRKRGTVCAPRYRAWRNQAYRITAAPFDRAEIERINRADTLAHRVAAVLIVLAALLAVFAIGMIDANWLHWMGGQS